MDDNLKPMLPNDVRLHVEGIPVTASAGDTVAAVLLSAGKRVFRVTSRRGEPRGLFCGMGICHDCQVCINGRPAMRACLVVVQDGMRVESQCGAGPWGHGT